MERLIQEKTVADLQPIQARGRLSQALLDALVEPSGSRAEAALNGLDDAVSEALMATRDFVRDEDLQCALFILYGMHYGGLTDIGDALEWNPQLVTIRLTLERAFERYLRVNVECPPVPKCDREEVAAMLFHMTAPDAGPSLSRYAAKLASDEQLREFLIQRSLYTLKEADPHSWAIPRLTGRAKAALIEIQADEYGQGRPEQMHATVFADTMRSVGLDDRYGSYANEVPAITLASFNMMSMFGLNRRLRGAIVGHLAAFEMTSSIPNRLYGNGFRRLGFGAETTRYFDIHVEADAIHEQIAARDLAGSLAEDEPDLIGDIVFGAASCLAIDGMVGAHILDAWQGGRSSLRQPTPWTAAP